MPKNHLSPAQLADAIRANEPILTAFYQENYPISLEKNIFDGLNSAYFRAQFIGFGSDKLPIPQRNQPDKPLIFISNHSGMAFPWDAMVMNSGLFKLAGHQLYETPRTLVAPMLSQTNLMCPYTIPSLWHRASGLDATTLNFETMMQYNTSNVLIYPEGVPGIGKGFSKKYELQQFSTSFVRMSLKHRTDVYPILSINGEYINPYAYTWEPINRLTRKIGIPFLPLSPILIALLLQPWIFYFGFPAQLNFVLGKKISPYLMTDKHYDDITDEEVRAIRDKIRASMQSDMNAAVAEYGQKPWDFWNLIKTNLQQLHKFPFFNAPTWVLLFLEHERRFKQHPETVQDMQFTTWDLVKSFFYNPLAICFFIPILGWIPIAIKGYKNHRIDASRVSVPK
jgi:1-acyl-sn-glycerol-3-phosphate acyltransferase